jgi:hypothetical protein
MEEQELETKSLLDGGEETGANEALEQVDAERLERIANSEEELSEEDKAYLEKHGDKLEDESSIQEDIQGLLSFEYGEEIIKEGTPDEVAKFAEVYGNYRAEEAEKNVWQALYNIDPELYEAYIYASKGGNFRDFIEGTVSYSEVELSDDDTDRAKAIVSSYLKKTGQPEKVVKMIVNQLEDEGELVETARGYISLEVEESREIKEHKLREQQEEQNRLMQMADNASTYIHKQIVNTGNIGDMLIPVNSRKEFDSYVRSKMQVLPNGNFKITEEFNKEQLDNILQAEYFKFKDGNLAEIVKKKAASENVKRIKKAVESTKINSKTTSDPNKFQLSDLSKY